MFLEGHLFIFYKHVEFSNNNNFLIIIIKENVYLHHLIITLNFKTYTITSNSGLTENSDTKFLLEPFCYKSSRLLGLFEPCVMYTVHCIYM